MILLAAGLALAGCEKPVALYSSTGNPFPHDALSDDARYLETLRDRFPDHEIPVYESNGKVLLGIVEDFEDDRILLVGVEAWAGSVEILRNGEAVEPPFEEERIKQYGAIADEKGSRDDASQVFSNHLGYWISLSEEDTFDLRARIDMPDEVDAVVSYDQERGWSGAIESRAEEDDPSPED